MNKVVEEMRAVAYSGDELLHYGMPRRSGRYPFGSGKDPYQHGRDFLGRIEELKKQGWQETPENIKNEFGLTTTQYRTEKSIATGERKMLERARAKSLAEDGLGASEIGRIMGASESTVRGWLNSPQADANLAKATETANFLKARVKEFEADGGMIDVGAGAELELNVSREKLNQSLYILQREGYEVYGGGIPQVNNPGQQTNQLVLCPPGTPNSAIYQYDKVHTIKDYITRDGGETYEKKFTYPESMDSKRLKIRYSEDGGLEKDGTVELRRGVADLSLGESRYSQVRILVDGSHYIKGMAYYSDDMPDGVDVIFNTNKKRGTPMESVLKEIKNDPDNPFGSAIKDAEQGGQYWYDPKNGERCSSKTPGAKLGLINKRADEGDWSDWKDALPSQFLGKQSLAMAKKQLNLAKAAKQDEYEDIMALNNPTIKKHFLEKFADSCDSAAVHLQAAALPGQKYHAIMPINTLKDTEVYAPNYKDGTKLALIRYPHGGTFEIPILTVNNKNALAKKILGTDSPDVVGITSKVAGILSGADFDGDTVMCIPTHDPAGKVKIASKQPLKGLKDFEAKDKYAAAKTVKDTDGTEHYYRADGSEFRRLGKKATQTQMGVISNLITDMTLAGANDTELAAAVRHSMVIIDAHKHKLDYKQSEVDNNIAALHKKYQGKESGGAATILSRSKGQKSVIKRQGNPKINIEGTDDYDPTRPEGALIYKTSDKAYYDVTKTNKRTGETKTVTMTRMQKSTKMAETDDAYTLVSKARHPMELVYADYANSMKALANQARKEQVSAGKQTYSKAAAETYKEEVKSLKEKVKGALLNATRERAAERAARAEVDAKLASGQIEKSDTKKVGTRALAKYRDVYGAKSRKTRNVNITTKEWEAIQAGAISEKLLKDILNNTDIDKLREYATPRTSNTISTAKIARIKNMSKSNYTLEQIARQLNLSPTTVSKYLKGVN